MGKIRNYKELIALKNKYSNILNFRNTKGTREGKMEILVCGGTGCKASNSDEIINSF